MAGVGPGTCPHPTAVGSCPRLPWGRGAPDLAELAGLWGLWGLKPGPRCGSRCAGKQACCWGTAGPRPLLWWDCQSAAFPPLRGQSGLLARMHSVWAQAGPARPGGAVPGGWHVVPPPQGGKDQDRGRGLWAAWAMASQEWGLPGTSQQVGTLGSSGQGPFREGWSTESRPGGSGWCAELPVGTGEGGPVPGVGRLITSSESPQTSRTHRQGVPGGGQDVLAGGGATAGPAGGEHG